MARQLALAGDQRRAAVLLGATENIREIIGMRPGGRRAEAHQELVEEVGKPAGNSERDRMLAEGRAMSFEEAIALGTELEFPLLNLRVHPGIKGPSGQTIL